MRIQAIHSTTNRPTFQQKRPHEGYDRSATIQDLFESEDRIIANQEKLFARQNDALAKALWVIMNQNGGSKEVANFQMREADKSLSKLSPDMKNFK
ncbi:MAG: hypothetical protein K6E29_07620 [Cyanobacteria bacterium RUI128]|nr:hypothetical protein [Cyanobacteria bacterium RUI128]